MTAFAFAVLPLGRAGEVPATALFRQQGFEASSLPRWPYLLTAGLTLLVPCAWRRSGLPMTAASPPSSSSPLIVAFAVLQAGWAMRSN
jgi:predicted lysophospholipase L1 biosynthesis ABC-type transport system permease subunit